MQVLVILTMHLDMQYVEAIKAHFCSQINALLNGKFEAFFKPPEGISSHGDGILKFGFR